MLILTASLALQISVVANYRAVSLQLESVAFGQGDAWHQSSLSPYGVLCDGHGSQAAVCVHHASSTPS